MSARANAAEGFSADWLALRRDADRRSRNPAVLKRLAAHFQRSPGPRVLDLGAGTGNNMRLTAPLLPPGQHWTLADADAALLARASAPDGVETTARLADIARDLDSLAAGAFDLATCSALLDLCGAGWLDRLADCLARRRLPFFAALSCDGRQDWTPPRPDDGAVLAGFHADQRRDKGFGPALGPRAHAHLARALRRRGFEVCEGASDWVLTRADAPLIAALAEGVGRAAGDDAWGAARRGADRVRIGHRDLFAVPPPR